MRFKFPLCVVLILTLHSLEYSFAQKATKKSKNNQEKGASKTGEKTVKGSELGSSVLVKQGTNRSSQLQIAFVVDRTSHRYFYDQFYHMLRAIFKGLHWSFPRSEVALTTFMDYEDHENRARPGRRKFVKAVKSRRDSNGKWAKTRIYDDTDNCYSLEVPFGMRLSRIEEAFEKIFTEPNYRGAAGKENSVQAVYLTAVDSQIGWWTDDLAAKSGKSVKRLIILLTDNDYLNATSDNKHIPKGGKRPARGDGTDSCKTTWLVPPPELEKILRKKKIKLIVGVARTPEWAKVDLMEKYKSFLDSVNVPSEIFQFDLGDTFGLAHEILNKVYALELKDFEEEKEGGEE